MNFSLKKFGIRAGVSLLIGFGCTIVFCTDCLYEPESLGIGTLYASILSLGLWEGNGILSDWLTLRFPWDQKTVLRLVLGVVTSVLYSGIFIAIWHYVFFVEIIGHSVKWYQEVFVANILIGILITAIISLFLHAREFLKAWRMAELRAERLERERMQSRLQSLKDQLNPHFLFNSLNVLTSLVHKDPDQAEHFIRKLSEIYRYVLDKSEEETVPLHEELSFINSYLDLLKHRFGDNLRVDWDPPAPNGWSLPPLSLQLLVENAVKHNTVSRKKPLSIRIAEEPSGYIMVSNTLQTRNQTTPSSGVGLANIRARFAHLSDKPVVLNQAESRFSVHLPLLQFTPHEDRDH